MSVRAVLLGLSAVVLVIGVNAINKVTWRLPMDFGSHLPIGLYALLMLVILGANPLLYWLRRTWRLKAGEMAVIVAMAMSACHVAGWGFMDEVPEFLAMPLQLVQVNEGWRRHHLMDYVPPAMLVNDAQTADTSDIVSRFIIGRGTGPTLGLDAVPWHAWGATLSFWLPIIALMGLASLAMAMIVHRQWSTNERLRYPLADLTASLIKQDQGRWLGPIYRQRMFWVGLGGLLAINMVNYLAGWFPRYLITIPMSFDFSALTNRWPDLGEFFVTDFIKTPTIYTVPLAIAFLLASDVGLSLWSSHVASGTAKLLLTAWGFNVSTNVTLGGWDASTRFGAFVGTAGILLYIGRRYYGQVVRRAFTGRGPEVDPWTGWAFWLVVLPSAAVTILLIGQGLDWPMAIASVVMLLVLYLVVSRMTAEAGLYVVVAGWMPISVFWCLMGGQAAGIQNLLILGLLSMVLSTSTSDALMPYVVNSLRVADLVGVSAKGIGKAMSMAFVVALALAVVLTLWAYYNYGAPNDGWTLNNLPGRAFQAPYRAATTLSLSNMTQEVNAYTPLERFAHMTLDRSSRRFIGWTAFGLAAVLVLGALRLRFPWWPIHPIFVLVWGSWMAGVYSFSVLLGWLAKIVIVRLGGVQLYRKVQPMVAGIIAAEALTALIRLVVGAIYQQATGISAL